MRVIRAWTGAVAPRTRPAIAIPDRASRCALPAGVVIVLSIADDRTAGPFSRFPGYRRWSFLAGPAPIALDIGGTVHELVALGDHVEIGGDVAISCALPAGPTQLLNLVVRDGVFAEV